MRQRLRSRSHVSSGGLGWKNMRCLSQFKAMIWRCRYLTIRSTRTRVKNARAGKRQSSGTDDVLYAIDSDSEVTSIPHHSDYDRWRRRLTDREYQEIVDELNNRIRGTEVQT